MTVPSDPVRVHPSASPRAAGPRAVAGLLAPACALLAACAVLVSGCGSSSTHSAPPSHTASTPAATSSTTAPASPPPAINELTAAETPQRAQFPQAGGRSLQRLAKLAKSSAALGAATGTFTPGRRRFAFALTTRTGQFIYAPTALYIARTPTSPAQGPVLSPADPMTVAPQYRSKQNAGPGGIQAIYSANVRLPRAGTYIVLGLTKTSHGLIGSSGEVAVAASSPIPDVGQRPPAIATETPASVHGNSSLLTTRIPPDNMHQVSFNQVLGKRPIALLFSTPQLCTSRVCGPVTDVAVQLEQRFGKQITFIHQEVYVNNQPTKGLRPQLQAFHLRTEPWLFTINRRGVIAARVEGAFGVNTMTQALEAALR